MSFFYFTFAGPAGWLGGLYVEAESAEQAMKRTKHLHPAGYDDVVYFEAPPGERVPPEFVGRLITSLDEMREHDYIMGGDGEVEGVGS